VFQTVPPRGDVSLVHVADMLESTRTLSTTQRRDVFASNGICYDRVLKYYSTVVFMERMIGMDGMDCMDCMHQDYWQKIRDIFGIKSD
jgi:hypothetical protein